MSLEMKHAVPSRLPEMVVVPECRFLMGSEAGMPDEAPVHEVEVPEFRVAVRPVSNAEYALFLADTGAEAPPFADDPRVTEPDAPVVGVSWFDAVDYCNWLGLETGQDLRLPTEAERERAARGGLEGATWPWGDAPPESHPGAVAIAGDDRPHVPRPSCANGEGLLCMGDNVHEWCLDWHDPGFYAVSPVEGPVGPESGTRRASRGGSWRHQVKVTRVSARSSLPPDRRYNDYGFRVYAEA